MRDIAVFASGHKLFCLAMAALNLILAHALLVKLSVYTNPRLGEAMAGRNKNYSLYRRAVHSVMELIGEYARKTGRWGFYAETREKLVKSGYSGEHSATIYLFFKYVFPMLAFILVYVLNYPHVRYSVAVSLMIFFTVEYVVYRGKREMSMKFGRHVYKIYKYLHNQISSGIKPTDAIKTVYMVIEDKKLKEILIQLAARYELTLDIDRALEEFRSNFDLQEAETLCVALKQGVETGDNRELLARQEQYMFNKYFNYIQAETESCKWRGTLSVFIFASITVIMITVPLIKDVADAVGKIFVN
ncbi:MAG: type II secretion system F family protein [Clostridiales bacterium]|nr:type II secretion system F family protein [Eubacteriales bacterium]MDH7566144.1 type II secretion system F family protein [Clostridiales bacterium]